MYKLVVFWLVACWLSSAEAQEVTLEQSFLSQYLSPVNGVSVFGDLNAQTNLTFVWNSEKSSAYTGFFANYAFSDERVTEFDPYLGFAFEVHDDIWLNNNVTFVTSGGELVSLAGMISLEGGGTSSERNYWWKARFMPQVPVADFPSGYYLTIQAGMESSIRSFRGFRYGLEAMLTYDSGGYGFPVGFSEHLGGYIKHELNENNVLTLRGDLRQTADKKLERVLLLRLTHRF